jgi:hypothetical protein
MAVSGAVSFINVSPNTNVYPGRGPVMEAQPLGSPPPAKRRGRVRGGGRYRLTYRPPPTRLGPTVLATLPSASRGEGTAAGDRS